MHGLQNCLQIAEILLNISKLCNCPLLFYLGDSNKGRKVNVESVKVIDCASPTFNIPEHSYDNVADSEYINASFCSRLVEI